MNEWDMLCTPWLTINICFVFLMPTRGTHGLEKDGSWDQLERDAYWLFSVPKNAVSNLFTLTWTVITQLRTRILSLETNKYISYFLYLFFLHQMNMYFYFVA